MMKRCIGRWVALTLVGTVMVSAEEIQKRPAASDSPAPDTELARTVELQDEPTFDETREVPVHVDQGTLESYVEGREESRETQTSLAINQAHAALTDAERTAGEADRQAAAIREEGGQAAERLKKATVRSTIRAVQEDSWGSHLGRALEHSVRVGAYNAGWVMGRAAGADALGDHQRDQTYHPYHGYYGPYLYPYPYYPAY